MSIKILFLFSLGIFIFANFGIKAAPLHNAPTHSSSESNEKVSNVQRTIPAAFQINADWVDSSEEDHFNGNSRTKRAIKTSSFGNGRSTGQRPRSNSLPASIPSRTSSGLNFNSGNSFGSSGKSFSSSLPSTSLLASRSSLNRGTGGNLFSNSNGILSSNKPRSNSLSSTGVDQGLLGSSSNQLGKNNGFQKPFFGMGNSHSTSPVQSAGGSRRSSFGLQDELEGLSIRPKTANELKQIESWEKRPINSAGLTDNCYFCTAAGLSGRTTNRLATKTETMQNQFGSLQDTEDLLRRSYHPNVQSRTFAGTGTMNNYLNKRLQPGTSDKFGVAYYPQGPENVGHMVGLKAWKDPQGNVGTRPVDFQLPPNQRFPPNVVNNNFAPPAGPVHLIDLNPLDGWGKRRQFQNPDEVPDSKRRQIGQ